MFGRRRRWRRGHWRCRNRRRRRWRFRLFKGLWCIPPQYCFQNQADSNQHENPWPPPSLPGQNGQTYQPHCPMQVAPGADQFSLLFMFAHSSSPSLASISQRLQSHIKRTEPPAFSANGSESGTIPMPRASSAQATRPDAATSRAFSLRSFILLCLVAESSPRKGLTANLTLWMLLGVIGGGKSRVGRLVLLDVPRQTNRAIGQPYGPPFHRAPRGAPALVKT